MNNTVTATLVRCLTDNPTDAECKYLWQIDATLSFFVSSSSQKPEYQIDEVMVFPSDSEGSWSPTDLAAHYPATMDKDVHRELVMDAYLRMEATIASDADARMRSWVESDERSASLVQRFIATIMQDPQYTDALEKEFGLDDLTTLWNIGDEIKEMISE